MDGGDNGGSSSPNDNHFASRANFETISGSKVGGFSCEVPLRPSIVPLLPRRASHCSLVSLTVRKSFFKILLSYVVYRCWRFVRGEERSRVEFLRNTGGRRNQSRGIPVRIPFFAQSRRTSSRFPPRDSSKNDGERNREIGIQSRLEFSYPNPPFSLVKILFARTGRYFRGGSNPRIVRISREEGGSRVWSSSLSLCLCIIDHPTRERLSKPKRSFACESAFPTRATHLRIF